MANSTAKLIVGAGLAGLAAGVLFAPKSGKETREDVKKKAHEVSTQANQQLETGKKKAAELKNSAAEQARKVRQSIVKKEKIDEQDEVSPLIVT